MKKFTDLILEYLKNWKNLMIHGIIGIAILIFAVFLPVSPWVRAAGFVMVVVFNIIRMTIEKKIDASGVAVSIEDAPENKRDV
jgi:diacylglycerol kinase